MAPSDKLLSDVHKLPQRHLTEVEKQFISLKLEQARLHREKARLILEKGVFVYVGAFVIAIVAKQNGFLPEVAINMLIIAGIIILLVTLVPYARTTKAEDESIEALLNHLVGR